MSWNSATAGTMSPVSTNDKDCTKKIIVYILLIKLLWSALSSHFSNLAQLQQAKLVSQLQCEPRTGGNEVTEESPQDYRGNSPTPLNNEQEAVATHRLPLCTH